MQLPLIPLVVFLLTAHAGRAQDTVLNRYGLWVIDEPAMLKRTIGQDPNKAMQDCKRIPGIVIDLRYAGKNNFMGVRLYPPTRTSYLRKPAIDSLTLVQQELNQLGLGLKIFDAYRPYSVTEKMWEPVKDDRYAADPKKGSGHNRGIAVDLTIIALATGKELPMGTGFDNFSDTAHHGFSKLPDVVLQNRLLLKATMEKHGFTALPTEWWHYYLEAFREFELLNVPFKVLKKNNSQ